MALIWSGMAEYREQLRQLPAACENEAAKIIEGEVNHAYRTVSTVYGEHRFTGTLQKRLRISELKPGAFRTGLKLTSGSPLAWLFDNGSQARHWASGKSTGAMWSKSPPTHIFARTVGQTKRRIVTLLKDAMTRRGATVTDRG